MFNLLLKQAEALKNIFLFILYNSLRETKRLSAQVTDTSSAGAAGAAAHTSKHQGSATTARTLPDHNN